MMHEMRNTTNPTHAQQLVKLQTGREVPEILRELYVDRHLSQAEVAAELGISRMTVAMWLREHSISRDEQAEATA
jgi:DNA-binding XRE family transcriptional regulator